MVQRLLRTGEVARLVGLREPRIQSWIRQGILDPAPPVVAGLRLWSDADVDRLRVAAAKYAHRRPGRPLTEVAP